MKYIAWIENSQTKYKMYLTSSNPLCYTSFNNKTAKKFSEKEIRKLLKQSNVEIFFTTVKEIM